jgi:hypothetical protein
MTWPRPRRAPPVTAGCEARGKAQGRPTHPGATGGGQAGRVCDARSHALSEHANWRFEQYRRRSSGPVLMAWPRPDVRRRRSRRGSKLQAKAQGCPFHPGATGERQGGRVKNVNLWLMSRYGQLRRWDAVAEYRDSPLRSGRRRLGSPPRRGEHRRPRDTGGTHPARSSCARNVVTPVVVRAIVSGKPTARKA